MGELRWWRPLSGDTAKTWRICLVWRGQEPLGQWWLQSHSFCGFFWSKRGRTLLALRRKSPNLQRGHPYIQSSTEDNYPSTRRPHRRNNTRSKQHFWGLCFPEVAGHHQIFCSYRRVFYFKPMENDCAAWARKQISSCSRHERLES